MKLCEHCQKKSAILRRPKNRMMVCKECFYELFETEIHDALICGNVFTRGDRIAIGVSGGKGKKPTQQFH
jgi:cytoplasmic tRNA 2-thiolation protein 1